LYLSDNNILGIILHSHADISGKPVENVLHLENTETILPKRCTEKYSFPFQKNVVLKQVLLSDRCDLSAGMSVSIMHSPKQKKRVKKYETVSEAMKFVRDAVWNGMNRL
jgi:hypothetical protein